VIYTLAWVAGLVVAPSSTNVNATGAQVVAANAGHEAALVAQFVLTEGIASLALAVVAIALARAGVRAGAPARTIAVTGIAAAGIALVQCVLGVVLALAVIPGQHAGAAATVNDTITRLDGAKMLMLAAMAVAGAVTAARTGVLPRWLRGVGVALAVAITVSGVGYALLNNPLAAAAWVSLPLLLVFVTGAGIVLARATHRG
jgi:hypothetical protein